MVSQYDFKDNLALPMKISGPVYGVAVAFCFILGQWIEAHPDSAEIEGFFSDGILAGRLDSYRNLSPETIPYFLASVIVSVPTAFICWVFAALRYRPLEHRSQIPALEVLVIAVFWSAFVLIGIYSCFLLVPGDLDGVGGFFTYPFLPFIAMGMAWLSTGAFIQFLPLWKTA